MKINEIKKIELEITSDCNAACPGCMRTINRDILEINSFGLSELQRLFPTREYIDGKQFKFCGVLGDPAANSECLQMVEYLATRGGWCQLSTNGGIQSAEWWRQLGVISRETNNVNVHFCVDGHRETNHIYRVNTVFKTVQRNMEAYASESHDATWIYIVFDHNEHELEAAQKHADKLNFGFATRTGMRNSYYDWVAKIRKRDEKSRKIVSEEKVITTTGNKEHARKDDVERIDRYLNTVVENRNTPEETREMIDSVVCKLVHEGEIFISSKLTLWPCCYLWDSSFKNKEHINERLDFGSGWNSLTDKSIEEVLQHPWFNHLLGMSWDPAHNLHLQRCIKTCALNKAYHNQIEYK